jgi:hypothetical protein
VPTLILFFASRRVRADIHESRSIILGYWSAYIKAYHVYICTPIRALYGLALLPKSLTGMNEISPYKHSESGLAGSRDESPKQLSKQCQNNYIVPAIHRAA